jgi:hypothetical protein
MYLFVVEKYVLLGILCGLYPLDSLQTGSTTLGTLS